MSSNPYLSYFKEKKILVTGASGYLATNLVASLAEVSCEITRLSRSEKLNPVKGICKIVNLNGDICDREFWSQAVGKKFDIFYHFSGQTSVYKADEDPFADWESNVLPMLHMLESCRKLECKPIIVFAGTVTEVGIPDSQSVSEIHKDFPVTFYDAHKLMAENYLKLYSSLGYVYGVTLRLPNIYGPGPSSANLDRGILNMMMRRGLNGENLTIYGKGDCLRDYLYVDDAVSAFLSVPEKVDDLNGRHFVLGMGEGYTIADAIQMVADRVQENTGKKIKVQHIDPPEGQSPIEKRNFVADSLEFSRATGWQAKVALMDGIDKSLDFMVAR